MGIRNIEKKVITINDNKPNYTAKINNTSKQTNNDKIVIIPDDKPVITINDNKPSYVAKGENAAKQVNKETIVIIPNNSEPVITINDNKPSYVAKGENNVKNIRTEERIVITPHDGSSPTIIVKDSGNKNSDSIIKIKDQLDASLLSLSHVAANDMGKINGKLEYIINGEVVTLFKDGEKVGYTSLDELKKAFGKDKVEQVKEIDKSGKLDGSKLDLSKIASTSANASNSNFIDENKIYKDSFNKELDYKVRDDGTVAISSNGVVVGFTTTAALESILSGKVSNNPQNNSTTQKNIDTHVNETIKQDPTPSNTNDQNNVQNNTNDQNITHVNTVLEAKADAIENASLETSATNDFNFKHQESNILAAKAKNMGFSDEQIKLAIGISRWETGNYEHLAGGHNYGGVTGVGDAGQSVFIINGKKYVYAKYSSDDVGMNAYLDNLKRNYIDQGLTTPESMARIYVGKTASEEHLAKWIKGVKGCMS